MTRYPRIEKPLNYCRSCEQDFASLESFDAHRVGVHEYTYSEGIAMEPMREDGRRCLSIEEMLTPGKRQFRQNAVGRWELAARAGRAARAFAPSSQGVSE